METLRQIGRLIPIDIFGLDFDVDDQGRVVFFEANPAMNLLSKAPPELSYPVQAQAALLDHIEQLFERRASQPRQALRLNA